LSDHRQELWVRSSLGSSACLTWRYAFRPLFFLFDQVAVVRFTFVRWDTGGGIAEAEISCEYPSDS
jgi:hypothetical protein